MRPGPKGSTGTVEIAGGAGTDPGPAPSARRPRRFRPWTVLGVALVGALMGDRLIWLMTPRPVKVVPGPPIAWGEVPPGAWPTTFTITFLDAATRRPVPGVWIGEAYDPPGEPNARGPFARGTADAQGRWTDTMMFWAAVRWAKDRAAFEGELRFDDRHHFVARAPGYAEAMLWPGPLLGTPRQIKAAPGEYLLREATVLLRPEAPPGQGAPR
jgi:hypothetical protein